MNPKHHRQQVHILAVGRVQGVGFRWTVKRVADESGVVGTVRNLRDGSVEVWAEAAQGVLVAFVGAVFRGSPAGEVRDLRIEWDLGRGAWTSFEIVS